MTNNRTWASLFVSDTPSQFEYEDVTVRNLQKRDESLNLIELSISKMYCCFRFLTVGSMWANLKKKSKNLSRPSQNGWFFSKIRLNSLTTMSFDLHLLFSLLFALSSLLFYSPFLSFLLSLFLAVSISL